MIGYQSRTTEVQRIDPEERLSFTIVATLGPFQLWVMPERESPSDPPSDRTLAMWVHEDADRVRILHTFRSALT